jgi:8-oxo-dGTP pyrophosphatase MutT (NUDIX family)
MRLLGLSIRGGDAEGPVTIDPTAGRPADGHAIAAFGELKGNDPRLSAPAGWAGITVASLLPPPPPPGPPLVAGIDTDVLRDGERVRLRGSAGTAELPGVAEVKVVTSFLQRPDGRILLLLRSGDVGSFRGRWAAVSGYLEDPTPEEQARREIQEETGIDPTGTRLASVGRPVYARDGMTVFTVHPFRFLVTEARVTLDWEHTEFEWVAPGEILRRETVPKLDRVWRAVAPGP